MNFNVSDAHESYIFSFQKRLSIFSSSSINVFHRINCWKDSLGWIAIKGACRFKGRNYVLLITIKRVAEVDCQLIIFEIREAVSRTKVRHALKSDN